MPSLGNLKEIWSEVETKIKTITKLIDGKYISEGNKFERVEVETVLPEPDKNFIEEHSIEYSPTPLRPARN